MKNQRIKKKDGFNNKQLKYKKTIAKYYDYYLPREIVDFSVSVNRPVCDVSKSISSIEVGFAL